RCGAPLASSIVFGDDVRMTAFIRGLVAILSLLAFGCSSRDGATTSPTTVEGGSSLPPSDVLTARAGGAIVRLPSSADGPVSVADDATGMEIEFTLERAVHAPPSREDTRVRYRGGGPFNSDLLHRVGPNGIEDVVVFETKPTAERLRYDVDVARVSGLRL